MSQMHELFGHYKSLIEHGELAPEDVPVARVMVDEWGVSVDVARKTRKLLLESGTAAKLTDALPLGPISDGDMARFWLKVDPVNADGCLLWNAVTRGDGYGGFSLNGRMVYAHRVVWEYQCGPVPVGMDVDHVWARGCRSRLCVNVEHLEAVTHGENLRRGAAAKRWRAGIGVRTELDDD